MKLFREKKNRVEMTAAGYRPSKALYWSLIISLVVHAVVIFYHVELPDRKKPLRKPMNVKFMQRAPRLSSRSWGAWPS